MHNARFKICIAACLFPTIHCECCVHTFIQCYSILAIKSYLMFARCYWKRHYSLTQSAYFLPALTQTYFSRVVFSTILLMQFISGAFAGKVYIKSRDELDSIQWNVQKYLWCCVCVIHSSATLKWKQNAKRKLKNQMLIHDVGAFVKKSAIIRRCLNVHTMETLFSLYEQLK